MSEGTQDVVALLAEIDLLKGAARAESERLQVAGLRVDLYYGCDTAEHMADAILALSTDNTRLREALEKAKRRGNGARERIIGALHEFSPGPIEEFTDLGVMADNIMASLTSDGPIQIARAAPAQKGET